MDSKTKDFSALVEELLLRVEALEKEVASLRGDAVPSEESSSEPIDLTLDPLPYIAPDIPEAASPEPFTVKAPAVEIPAVEMPAVEAPAAAIPAVEMPTVKAPAVEIPAVEMPTVEAPAEVAATVEIPEVPAVESVETAETVEDIPPAEEVTAAPEEVKAIVEKTQAAPEESPREDGPGSFENLFGGEQEAPAAARRGRRRRILNDLESETAGQSVMDAMADKAAWRHDIPGPEVKSLRSAIGLGDQVLFIRRLFRDDSALYQDSIDKLNNMSTLDEAIDYLSNTFPEWNVASDDVYRFMMAVRRKIRK